MVRTGYERTYREMRRAGFTAHRRALVEPEWEAPAAAAAAPRTAVEAEIAAVWAEVLRRPVGVHDDFFALGGHSLLAARLTARLREELGDLLLQVPLHTEIAEEEGTFTIEEVLHHLGEKLVRRHPHVFGEVEAETAGQVLRNWDAIKAGEPGREPGIFGDVPDALPALLEARKVQRRAAALGYAWPDLAGPLANVREELGELEALLTA